ncbi:MAG TPA: FkbM family methyltransferase [Bryobacteraceae bacterium]|jgi:FkbM family methyltransferase|nr:FkbM family methyltransferase [Bryobacteraceae bacterium]
MDSVSSKFLALAKRVLDHHPIICDIGSRDALEGIYLFQQLNAQEVHVFEPNPAAAKICRENLAGFTDVNASFNQVAVTDKTGQLKFYPVNPGLSENKDIGFSSLFRINPDYTKRRGQVVQDEVIVEATTLDAYFSGKQSPDLLWVDVEGAELEVLQGAANILNYVKLIHIEVSFRPMQIGKPLFWKIERFLAKENFTFYGFMEVSALRGFLYRHRLLPNLPWRLNAVFYRPN